MKCDVDINEVKRLKARLREINSLDIKDIRWMDGGRELEIPPDRVTDWSFCGMNNSDFIDTEFYLHGWTEVDIA